MTSFNKDYQIRSIRKKEAQNQKVKKKLTYLILLT